MSIPVTQTCLPEFVRNRAAFAVLGQLKFPHEQWHPHTRKKKMQRIPHQLNQERETCEIPSLITWCMKHEHGANFLPTLWQKFLSKDVQLDLSFICALQRLKNCLISQFMWKKQQTVTGCTTSQVNCEHLEYQPPEKYAHLKYSLLWANSHKVLWWFIFPNNTSHTCIKSLL